MSQSEDFDKSEKATPSKLKEARNKGQVSKSMEVNSVAILLTFILVTIAIMPLILEDFTLFFQKLFISSGQIQLTPYNALVLFSDSSTMMFTALAPIIVAVIIIAIVITMLQTKPIFTTHPLKPDFKKLNPISGFKKIFSMKALFELVKNSLKITAIGCFMYFGLKFIFSDLMLSFFLTQDTMTDFWLKYAKYTAFSFILVLLPFALFDLFFSKRDFANKMKMSKRDVKDEMKRSDGDPELKSKRKQIQKELSKKTGSIKNVKDADVILTNPTHFAVALKYKPHEMIAPIVIAKGRDKMAATIREQALKFNIPISRKPELTRLIYKQTDIDNAITEDAYSGVSDIYKWVFALKGRRV